MLKLTIPISERAKPPQGMFTRHLFLGDTLDGERISADYRDGCTTLTVVSA